jgi:uncharacterized membrane protein YeaQ/YmgE (transglycosylase-associated protein family)
MGIIAWIMLGLVAGIIAEKLLGGGRKKGIVIMTPIGVAGALLAGWAASTLLDGRRTFHAQGYGSLGGASLRNLASARCWATRTAPGVDPIATAVSSDDSPATTRSTTISRCLSVRVAQQSVDDHFQLVLQHPLFGTSRGLRPGRNLGQWQRPVAATARYRQYRCIATGSRSPAALTNSLDRSSCGPCGGLGVRGPIVREAARRGRIRHGANRQLRTRTSQRVADWRRHPADSSPY